MLLEIRDIEVRYQKTAALKGVSMVVPAGGIVTIIGANGAGKTTTLRAISGLEPLTRGEIHFDGARIDGRPPEEIVRRGIAHVPEGRRVFPDLTVEENLRTGAFLRTDRAAVEASLADVFGRFPRLAERRRQWARSMSGGEQQMLAIGRALMAEPTLLMIDEVSLGLMPAVIDVCYAALGRLRDDGLAILLVEQSTQRAFDIADAVCVLESGKAVWTGSAEAAREDPALVEAYLGLAG